MDKHQKIYSTLRKEKTIVGFCGKKRTGKDTAGEALKEMGYRTIAFADPIKTASQTVFRFTDRQVNGSLKSQIDEFWGFTPRWAMQTVGTELFRDGIDKNVWVKSLLARIAESNHDKFAVTDVRFPNEVQKLEKAGAQLVYISRPSVEPELNRFKKWFAKKGGVYKTVASFFTDFGAEYHASEISLDDHPVSNPPDVINDGTEEEFKKAIRKYVGKITGRKDGFVETKPMKATFLEGCLNSNEKRKQRAQ